MKCKKCGHEEVFNHMSYRVNPEEKFFSDGKPIPENYIGFSNIPCCEKCGEPYDDYIDLPVQDFLFWLDDAPNRITKGKAVIRYFGLDELLELKKNAGD